MNPVGKPATDVGNLPAVHLLVAVQLALLREALQAEPAHVQSLTSVDPLVSNQRRPAPEPLLTNAAHVGSFSGVHPLVRKHLWTTSMGLSVLSQAVLEAFLVAVHAHVGEHVGRPKNGPSVKIARVWMQNRLRIGGQKIVAGLLTRVTSMEVSFQLGHRAVTTGLPMKSVSV